MKKLFTLFAAALVMLAAASCEKNEVLPEGNTEGKVVTLKASINNGETKTSLGDGVPVPESNPVTCSYPVLWSEGDAIAVIQTNGVGQGQAARIFKFVLKEGDGGKTSGEFELEISDNCGYTASDFNASEEIIAFYPFEDVHYSGINEYNQFKISYNIPDEQVYAKNTFEKGASPMVAYRATDANGTLSFQNLFGVLKLQLQGANEKVQRIEIISSEEIAGNETSLTTSNKESLQFEYRFGSLDGRKIVTLDCGNDGVSINNLTTFMIALHPNATDLEVFIHTDKASYYKTIPTLDVNETPINDITAGNILAMGELNTADMAPAYIDENGVYQGDGIALPAGNDKTIIWAPVNCGYDDDHKYGLLYQWGRKYGQTYDGETPEVQIIKNTLSDAANGSSEDSKNKYFFGNVSTEDGGIEGVYYWLFPKATDLWNSNTETNPIKTAYDPCPEGWRVPTIAEMETLSEPQGQRDESDDHHRPPMGGSTIYYEGVWSTVGTDNDKHAGLTGCYFYGSTSEKTGSKVFFPAAGYRTFDIYGNSSAELRSLSGNYWSSTTADSNEDHSKIISFYNSGSTRSDSGSRVNGYSVRCVKE